MDPAPAADYIVEPGGQFPELWDALDDARTATNPDLNGDGVISICAEPGVYLGGHSLHVLDFPAPLWIWSSEGQDQTLIQGLHPASPLDRAFSINGYLAPSPPPAWPNHVVLRGFTVDGYTSVDPLGGGAMFVNAAVVTVQASRLGNLSAVGRGGAIAADAAELRVWSTEISGANVPASAHGGAIATDETALDIRNSTIRNGLAGWGGCVSATGPAGSAQILNTALEFCHANGSDPMAGESGSGGAVWFDELQWALVRDARILEGTTISGSGGGIAARLLGTLTLESSEVSTCTSQMGDGAGLWASAVSSVEVVDSGLFNNSSFTGRGGGLFIKAPFGLTSASVANTRIDKNYAIEGGGVATRSLFGQIELTVQDSLFESNHAAQNGGGGLSADAATLLVSHSDFMRNHAAGFGSGGAVRISGGGVADLIDVTASENEAGGFGGAVQCNGVGASRVFSITGGSFSQSLAGLGSGVIGGGGAVSSIACETDISFAHVEANCAPLGAGMYAENGSLLVRSTTFIDNGAVTGPAACAASPSQGGGLWVRQHGSVPAGVVQAHFEGNRAAGAGGGAFVRCDGATAGTLALDVVQTDFLSNESVDGGDVLSEADNGHGGGLAVLECEAALSDTLLDKNAAEGDGGGLWADGEVLPSWDPVSALTLSLDGVTFRGNFTAPSGAAGVERRRGGGLYARWMRVNQWGGGGYDGNYADLSGGGVHTDDPSHVGMIQVTFHENIAAGGVGGAMRFAGATIGLENVLVAENQQDEAALSLTASQYGPSALIAEHLTVAGNYANAPTGVPQGVRFIASGGSWQGTIDSSFIGMNEGVQQMEGDTAIQTSYSALYAHDPVTTALAALMDGDAYASANGCFGDNPGFEGGFIPGTGFESSYSNTDPWDNFLYLYYSYALLPQSTLVGAGAASDDIGAFGGAGGGWCLGLEPDTCLP